MNRTLMVVLLTAWCSSSAMAQDVDTKSHRRLVFSGGYSLNADYVPNRRDLLVVDQRVSPFFSHGGGKGFEASITRFVNEHVGITLDLSGYFDNFAGGATYCSLPTGCASPLVFSAKTRTFYLTAGTEFRARHSRRLSPFAHTLLGIVYSRSKFMMAGSNVEYFDPYIGGGLIVVSGTRFARDPTVSYSDSNADVGLTMTVGGGLDVRINRKFTIRTLVDYDPTFLVRPDGDAAVVQPGPSTRHWQDHARLTFGLVWRVG